MDFPLKTNASDQPEAVRDGSLFGAAPILVSTVPSERAFYFPISSKALTARTAAMTTATTAETIQPPPTSKLRA
jgi:hypothetical protein